MPIPRFRPSLGGAEFKASLCFLTKTTVSSGVSCEKGCEQIRYFEEEFARVMGRKHAVAVPSARVGFNLVLRSLALEAGSEIVLPAYTHPSVPLMLQEMGFTLQFADISRETFTVTPETVEAVMSDKTRIIIPTHLYGLPCDVETIGKLADKAGTVMIEDCAQSCGASINGRRTGSFGRAGIYSFGIAKNLTTLAGGLVVCDDDSLADFLRSEVSSYGMLPALKLAKDVIMAGIMMVVTQRVVFPHLVKPCLVLFRKLTGNDLLDTMFAEDVSGMTGLPQGYFNRAHRPLQAVIGRCQLTRLDDMNERRREIAKALREAFADVETIGLPDILPGACPVYPTFPIVVPGERSRIAARCQQEGIDTSEGFIPDCTSLPFLKTGDAAAPNAAYLADRILHLPVYPSLEDMEVDMTARIVPDVVDEVTG